jgi:peptidoglycan/xylan/chitin deacetylase (PgdA/CDA1 family)
MSNLLRRASKAVFAALDIWARPLTGPRILIYHQIGGGSGLEMEVAADEFVRQVDWIANRYPIVDLCTALARPDTPSVVLTFDDGYRSVFDVAYPILRARGVPFTLYLTTGPIESSTPMRTHAGAEPLRWEMVRKMLASGLATVGAHTHTHPDLRSLTKEEVEREISQSDELLEGRLGLRPEHFAYPWGYWSDEADVVIRSRYKTAALGSPLPRRTLNDPHLLFRLPVQNSDTRPWFERRVKSGLLFEEAVRRRIHGFVGPER